MPTDFGINLVASVSGNAGLGVTARNIALALQRHDVPFVIADVQHPWGGKLPLERINAPIATAPEDLRYPNQPLCGADRSARDDVPRPAVATIATPLPRRFALVGGLRDSSIVD